ncbi:MAG: hypothetical protein Q9204_008287 [Flavoplaca sp. TL-2023a]
MTRSAAAAAAAANQPNNNNITNNLTKNHQNRSPSTSTTPMTRQNNHQTGRAVLSRIERIEKEQMENKSMLTQILGAVTRPASADISLILNLNHPSPPPPSSHLPKSYPTPSNPVAFPPHPSSPLSLNCQHISRSPSKTLTINHIS